MATGNGTLIATTSFSYDHVGNRTATDAPGVGSADVTYTTYDAARRPIFVISADPDGTGPASRQIVKHVYDANGREIRTEYGNGNSITGADFVMAHFKRMTFDPVSGYLVKTEEVQP